LDVSGRQKDLTSAVNPSLSHHPCCSNPSSTICGVHMRAEETLSRR
jgi:hypothetical protein